MPGHDHAVTSVPSSEAGEETRMLLLSALLDLHDLVMAERVQPRHQMAERAVLHWMHVVEGKASVQPRITPSGVVPQAFHFGVETNADNWIDACVPMPAPERATFDARLGQRLEALRAALEAYFHPSGYRNSSEQCDRMLVELSRLSRFLSTWCAVAERQAERAAWTSRRHLEPLLRLEIVGTGREPPPDPALPARVRDALFTWEPPLNEAIVAWEENALQLLDRSLQALETLLELPEAELGGRRYPAGYPVRQRGRPRIKVQRFSPEQRPTRSKSIFGLRLQQLVQRVDEWDDPPPGLWEELLPDVENMMGMIRSNEFMLVSGPGFWNAPRAGQELIRGRPAAHPFLLDPMGFFKKALLFHNRTYTEAGGGPDMMFQQLQQFMRYGRFHPNALKRPVRAALDEALRGWEENRWDTFTESMLRLAELLRNETGDSPA
ncbi:MAG: hypothetical protein HY342_13330 [Candidatus Lambdaproteobacteria bacterium]|nr:hypothetical protein [Candidatus Lambdaproteobacteria bacterium]